MHKKYWLENLKGRDHLEEQDANGKIIIKILHIGCEIVNCIHLV
jgi:hypothetical protein